MGEKMNVTSSIVPLLHAGGRVLVEFDNGEMKIKGVKKISKREESFGIVVLDVKLLREWFLAARGAPQLKGDEMVLD